MSLYNHFFFNCILSPLGKCGWRTGARKVTDSIHLETHMAKSAATIRLKPTVGDREARQRTAQPAQCYPKAPGTSDSFTSDYTTLFLSNLRNPLAISSIPRVGKLFMKGRWKIF